MKKFLCITLLSIPFYLQAQNTGIGTINPQAVLHVNGKSLLITSELTSTPGAPPAEGNGSRMMWYGDKMALRAGYVSATRWDKDSIGLYSFAAGVNNMAKGEASTALGTNNDAVGLGSAAMGRDNLANGYTAFAAGFNCRASGTASFALGENAAALGDYSVALGYNTTVQNAYSLATGYLSTATGSYSIAMGENCKAIRRSGVAIGSRAVASGNYSHSIGTNVTARAYGSVAIGTYNDSVSTSNIENWVDTDPLLYVGNGQFNGRSNALVIYKNANTDINGYTRLGSQSESAPRIKMKEITGTLSPAADGASSIVAHGLSRSKILAINILLVYGQGDVIPGFRATPGYEYSIAFDDVNIYIYNIAGNSSNILSKPLKIIITYKE